MALGSKDANLSAKRKSSLMNDRVDLRAFGSRWNLFASEDESGRTIRKALRKMDQPVVIDQLLLRFEDPVVENAYFTFRQEYLRSSYQFLFAGLAIFSIFSCVVSVVFSGWSALFRLPYMYSFLISLFGSYISFSKRFRRMPTKLYSLFVALKAALSFIWMITLAVGTIHLSNYSRIYTMFSLCLTFFTAVVVEVFCVSFSHLESLAFFFVNSSLFIGFFLYSQRVSKYSDQKSLLTEFDHITLFLTFFIFLTTVVIYFCRQKDWHDRKRFLFVSKLSRENSRIQIVFRRHLLSGITSNNLVTKSDGSLSDLPKDLVFIHYKDSKDEDLANVLTKTTKFVCLHDKKYDIDLAISRFNTNMPVTTITNAIIKADTIVFVVSPTALNNGKILDFISLAYERDKPLMVVMTNELDLNDFPKRLKMDLSSAIFIEIPRGKNETTLCAKASVFIVQHMLNLNVKRNRSEAENRSDFYGNNDLTFPKNKDHSLLKKELKSAKGEIPFRPSSFFCSIFELFRKTSDKVSKKWSRGFSKSESDSNISHTLKTSCRQSKEGLSKAPIQEEGRRESSPPLKNLSNDKNHQDQTNAIMVGEDRIPLSNSPPQKSREYEVYRMSDEKIIESSLYRGRGQTDENSDKGTESTKSDDDHRCSLSKDSEIKITESIVTSLSESVIENDNAMTLTTFKGSDFFNQLALSEEPRIPESYVPSPNTGLSDPTVSFFPSGAFRHNFMSRHRSTVDPSPKPSCSSINAKEVQSRNFRTPFDSITRGFGKRLFKNMSMIPSVSSEFKNNSTIARMAIAEASHLLQDGCTNNDKKTENSSFDSPELSIYNTKSSPEQEVIVISPITFSFSQYDLELAYIEHRDSKASLSSWQTLLMSFFYLLVEQLIDIGFFFRREHWILYLLMLGLPLLVLPSIMVCLSFYRLKKFYNAFIRISFILISMVQLFFSLTATSCLVVDESCSLRFSVPFSLSKILLSTIMLHLLFQSSMTQLLSHSVLQCVSVFVFLLVKKYPSLLVFNFFCEYIFLLACLVWFCRRAEYSSRMLYLLDQSLASKGIHIETAYPTQENEMDAVDLIDKGMVFLSYSHKEKNFATKVANRLSKCNYIVWIDQMIRPARDWKAEIWDAIEQSLVVVFIVNRYSIKSKYCLQELEVAFDKRKPIITVVQEDCLSQMSPSIKAMISNNQWINFESKKFSDAFRELLLGLDEILASHPLRKISSSVKPKPPVKSICTDIKPGILIDDDNQV